MIRKLSGFQLVTFQGGIAAATEVPRAVVLRHRCFQARAYLHSSRGSKCTQSADDISKMAVTQAQKIIATSTALALGLFLLFWAGSHSTNPMPMYTMILVYIIAPLPANLCSKVSRSFRRGDPMDDAPDFIADFGRFLTGFLLTSNLVLPLVYARNGLIPILSMIFHLLAGFLGCVQTLTLLKLESDWLQEHSPQLPSSSSEI